MNQQWSFDETESTTETERRETYKVYVVYGPGPTQEQDRLAQTWVGSHFSRADAEAWVELHRSAFQSTARPLGHIGVYPQTGPMGQVWRTPAQRFPAVSESLTKYARTQQSDESDGEVVVLKQVGTSSRRRY